MDEAEDYDYFIIRDGTILVRVPHGMEGAAALTDGQFFDVKTGVQLRAIYPSLIPSDLARGYPLSAEYAAAILRSGRHAPGGRSEDISKVVSILSIRQRRLDGVVADSILDQLQVVRDILQDFLNVASEATPEERFWLSQQILPMLRKFSGRELSEIEEIVDWFNSRPNRS
jgi:hypothetical protein